ncbi:hypothetical protein [Allomesorhizobium alhagi]|uniref:Uncharacterized protein n=1 Tax=Mesorhizobium alhagi CCNWXJ12-2 TaxID=1107882 RepID=H0HXA5_9HYPH|nr:hypothetical protein [Mesorhizobium alhagi]EHK54702.1 hypothetical protein MAXJ12_24122 [Mesorhizobium alhagi CCNWXJ12-2]
MRRNAIQIIWGVPIELFFAEASDAEASHEQWSIVCRELQDGGTLAISNGHAIKRLVKFRVQFEQSSCHGPIITAKRAKIGLWNPTLIGDAPGRRGHSGH